MKSTFPPGGSQGERERGTWGLRKGEGSCLQPGRQEGSSPDTFLGQAAVGVSRQEGHLKPSVLMSKLPQPSSSGSDAARETPSVITLLPPNTSRVRLTLGIGSRVKCTLEKGPDPGLAAKPCREGGENWRRDELPGPEEPVSLGASASAFPAPGGLGEQASGPPPRTFNALHCRKDPTLIRSPKAQSLGALLSSLAYCQLAPASEDGSLPLPALDRQDSGSARGPAARAENPRIPARLQAGVCREERCLRIGVFIC